MLLIPISRSLLSVFLLLSFSNQTFAEPSAFLRSPPRLSVVLPPLDSEEHMSTPGDFPPQLPVADTPFFVHVRRDLNQQEQAMVAELSVKKRVAGFPQATTL